MRPKIEPQRCRTATPDRSDPQSPRRREALKTLGKTIGALTIGPAALSVGACAGALVDPEATTELLLAEVPQGRKMIMHADRRVELRRAGDVVTARLMICTHEFCDITWYAAEDNYRCTCHEGKFFPDGRPKSGPVSKPMFEIPTRITGETLIVGPAGVLELTG
jgi:nitrite reductase/ring-hydroxylating ferredoxin subunit